MAEIYRRKVARLAEALERPEDRDEASSAIRGLIERIVLTPGEKWGEVHATLLGDLGTILEWTGNGERRNKGGTSPPGLSVSVATGTRYMVRKSHREGISLIELAGMSPDEESAVRRFEETRWSEGRYCGHCDAPTPKEVPNARPMPYWCRGCKSYFSICQRRREYVPARRRKNVPRARW